MSGSKPSSIKLPAAGSSGQGSPAEGKTPTQETSQGESLSKRRGSESLSIGIPAGVSAALKKGGGAAGGSGSLSVTPMDTPKDASLKRENTLKKGANGANAGGASRPAVSRHNAAVADGSDDDDDEEGYEGEREAAAGRANSGSNRQKKSSNSTNGHASRAEMASNSSASSQSTMTGAPTTSGASGMHNLADRQNKQANCVQKDAANAHQKKGPAQHSFDIHGTQPVRNHHHRASTTSSINSTRRDKDIPCFPTPGMKDENRNPFEEEKSFEEIRLLEAQAKTRHWKRWGPYLSERQWVRVTVRSAAVKPR